MRWNYPHLWAYLWECKGGLAWSAFSLAFCITWLVVFAEGWWRWYFVTLAVINVLALLGYVRTYYRVIVPHMAWRREFDQRVQAAFADLDYENWELGPDAMHVRFDKGEHDEERGRTE
jgi:hypothetical protein